MNILSRIRFLKIVQNVLKKWLINLSEELDTKALPFFFYKHETNSNLVLICSLCFYILEKIKNTFDFN